MPDKTYTFQLEVRDSPGTLVRVAQVFARRGCAIDSIEVKRTPGSQWSYMTIMVHTVARVEHIVSQLEKLVDVHQTIVTER